MHTRKIFFQSFFSLVQQAAVSVDTHPAAPEGVIYQLVSDVVALAPLVQQVLLTERERVNE